MSGSQVGQRPKVAVLGASGYAGRELCGLVERHPGFALAGRFSARLGVEPEAPQSPVDAPIERLDLERLDGLDGVFVCAPHGASAPLVQAALARGLKVVDLSADFRLRDGALYERVYGAVHPAPELLDGAVYGLTEERRADVQRAQLVANPGCYPTSVLLPLVPLVRAGLLAKGSAVVADCKSGLSGAGKEPSAKTHFGAVHENFAAYGVGTHRHQPEIEQEALGTKVVFVPHLLPVFRGILSTLYLDPAPGIAARDVLDCLQTRYAAEPFVRVFASGLPDLSRVQRTNQCHIGAANAFGKVVVVSCLDNLVKGAAGQALQNMNLMLGRPETEGLC